MTLETGMATDHTEVKFPLSLFPRVDSMDCNNDPRFFSTTVLAKRLVAFQTISVIAVLMVTLSVKMMFALDHGTIDELEYAGFCVMTAVFVMNLFTVIVLIQQLFQTFRLLTTGPIGFEIAKSYYLNSNIVAMRHLGVRCLLFSLPLFVGACLCMVYKSFGGRKHLAYSLPVCILLVIFAFIMAYLRWKHSAIFHERYAIAKQHEEPLMQHLRELNPMSRVPRMDV